MNETFITEHERIRSIIHGSSTAAELAKLDDDIAVVADALELRTRLLETKLLRLQGAIAVRMQNSELTRLDHQAHESAEQ